MILADIVQKKGRTVYTISPTATLSEVVEELVRRNIGSLIVCDQPDCDRGVQVLGIITERDILRALATSEARFGSRVVREIMTRELVSAAPQDPIEHAMHLMTKHRVRHLPIIEGGQLYGVISIGDVVKAHHNQLEMENHFMRSYIQGEGAEIATP